MKKLLPCIIVAAMLALPSISMARGHRHKISGEVTAVKSTTITIEQDTRMGDKIVTIFVPPGTPINGKLSDLVGKHVTVKESSPGTAKEITVKGEKGSKSTSS